MDGAEAARGAAALRAGTPPDLRGRIDAPLPGDTVGVGAPELAIVGAVEGADVAEVQLELGAGDEPTAWTALELLAAPPFGPRELARLPLADLPDGAYVLRLTLAARDGTTVREFTPISIDRNEPVFVSSEEHAAQAPDVHGARVVWQSLRAGSEAEVPELDLFLGEFGVAGERALVTDVGHQLGAVVSGSAVVWQEHGALGTGHRVVRACTLARERDSCRPFDVSEGPGHRSAPQLSGRRIAYTETVAGTRSLQVCRLGGRACRGGPIAPETADPRGSVIEGHRVVWANGVNPSELLTCRLGPAHSCDVAPLYSTVPFLDPVAFSDPWLASISFASGSHALALYACEMDLAASLCDAREIASFPDYLPATADLSGGRLVWHGVGAHGQPDVYFCELATGADPCPAQAITRDAANQTQPRIDGAHVVWVDDRGGVPRVASFELPTIAALRDRDVREGELLSVDVRVDGPRLPVVFSLRERTRGDAGALGVRLEPRDDTRARFRWRPAAGLAGSYEFVLRATRAGGLYTETTLRVDVRAVARIQRRILSPGP